MRYTSVLTLRHLQPLKYLNSHATRIFPFQDYPHNRFRKEYSVYYVTGRCISTFLTRVILNEQSVLETPFYHITNNETLYHALFIMKQSTLATPSAVAPCSKLSLLALVNNSSPRLLQRTHMMVVTIMISML
jgi:hypothetical protein